MCRRTTAIVAITSVLLAVQASAFAEILYVNQSRTVATEWGMNSGQTIAAPDFGPFNAKTDTGDNLIAQMNSTLSSNSMTATVNTSASQAYMLMSAYADFTVTFDLPHSAQYAITGSVGSNSWGGAGSIWNFSLKNASNQSIYAVQSPPSYATLASTGQLAPGRYTVKFFAGSSNGDIDSGAFASGNFTMTLTPEPTVLASLLLALPLLRPRRNR